MTTPIVKARLHHGTTSLDLTVPSDLCSKYGVAPGDAFEVSVKSQDGVILIVYARIYKQSPNIS